MRTRETPGFIEAGRFETQAIDSTIDQVSQSRTRVFNQLRIGRAGRRLIVVAPARHPAPFTGRISLIEPHLDDRPSRPRLLKARKKAGLAIVVRFNVHDHGTISSPMADSLLNGVLLERMSLPKVSNLFYRERDAKVPAPLLGLTQIVAQGWTKKNTQGYRTRWLLCRHRNEKQPLER